jgi:hypothetical protein
MSMSEKAARDKFLRHLRRQMKHGQSAGERVSAQKLYAQMMGAGTDSGEFGIDHIGKVIENGQPIELQSTLLTEPDLSDYAQEARRAVSQPRSELSCLLLTLHVPVWMSGSWGDVDGGWTNAKDHDKLLTYDAAKVLIADRFKDLGLDPATVHAHPKSRCTIAEDFAFRNMSFEEQMERFRPEVLR